MKETLKILRALHFIAAIIHIVSSILSFSLDKTDISSDITVPKHNYYKKPIRTNTTYTIVWETCSIDWVTVNEAITAFSHLIALWLLYDRKDAKKEPIRRAIEYSITAGVLQVALVLPVGQTLLHDIIFLLVVNLCIQWIGYEIDKRIDLLYPLFLLLASEITYVILHGSNLSGISNQGYYTFMGVAYAVFYILFGVVKIPQLNLKDIETELFILMSVTSKVSLSWILIGNTYQGFKDMGEDKGPDIDWRALQIAIVSVSALILTGGTYYLKSNKDKLSTVTSAAPEGVGPVRFKKLRY